MKDYGVESIRDGTISSQSKFSSGGPIHLNFTSVFEAHRISPILLRDILPENAVGAWHAGHSITVGPISRIVSPAPQLFEGPQ
jgi:hypothetical protein